MRCHAQVPFFDRIENTQKDGFRAEGGPLCRRMLSAAWW
jgi:hypothetical protein